MANDVQFLARIMASFEKWGLEIDAVMHSAVLQGLQARDLTKSVLWWLEELSARPGPCRPQVEWWNTHLADCIRLQRVELFWKSMESLQHCHTPRPDGETYRLVFKQLLAEHHSAIPPRVCQTWVDNMAADGVPFTRSLFETLVVEFTKAGAQHVTASLERMYLLATHAEGKDSLCAKRVAETIRGAGDAPAHALFLRFHKHGFVPTPATLDVIANTLTSPTALRKWETWLGVTASPRAWESFMTRLSTDGQWRSVRSAYHEAVRQGQKPTAGMLFPVLQALCAKLSQPTDDDIAKALELFREYLQLTSDDAESIGRRIPEAQQDLPLYNIILRSL